MSLALRIILSACLYWRTLTQRNVRMPALTQPGVRGLCMTLGALCTLHSGTNIYKTKKVRKSKISNNTCTDCAMSAARWRWFPNWAPDNFLAVLSQYECILEAAGNQRILSKVCILLGATGILLLLNTLLFRYFYSMRDERGFHLIWCELPALNPDKNLTKCGQAISRPHKSLSNISHNIIPRHL